MKTYTKLSPLGYVVIVAALLLALYNTSSDSFGECVKLGNSASQCEMLKM